MPADALKTSLKELKRFKKMPPQMPEHAMLRYRRDGIFLRVAAFLISDCELVLFTTLCGYF